MRCRAGRFASSVPSSTERQSVAGAAGRRGDSHERRHHHAAGDEKFVSLTTFKRNGDVVASPMWIARDGEQPILAGTAEVITESNEVARVEALIKQKYGVEFRVVTFVETIAARGRKPRVVLRITSTGPA
jgi:hypothetical protein